MRILIYGINFAPELTGIGKYTGEMAAYLAARGHAVRVITAPPYYPWWRIQPGYSGGAYRKENWKGVEVYRCPLWLPASPAAAGKISGFQRLLHLGSFAASSLPVVVGQVRWRPERVMVLAPSLFNAPLAVLLARLCGAKAWLHIQDFELDAAQRLRILPRLAFLFHLALKAESALYRSFDAVSTISSRMVAKLKEKGVAPQRALYFPNWVDPEQIFPLPGYNALRDELEIPSESQVILYSGSMGQKQGLELLVEAARLLAGERQILFLMCGEGPARPWLEQLAGSQANLRFLPLQPPERLNEMLNLAAIHVLPQKAGAADLVMPSKLGGMLASGRVVIAAAEPGTELAEVIEPLGRVVPPEQAQSLAEEIRRLVDQPALREELGCRGRSFVEKTWAKDHVLGEFLQALQSL
jgi:colanic acid biosynthesis glycosyl transferase WcaI